jgi:hypothetical protein
LIVRRDPFQQGEKEWIDGTTMFADASQAALQGGPASPVAFYETGDMSEVF